MPSLRVKLPMEEPRNKTCNGVWGISGVDGVVVASEPEPCSEEWVPADSESLCDAGDMSLKLSKVRWSTCETASRP